MVVGKGVSVELNSLSDVKLVGRALTQGWLTDHAERRRSAINALFDVVENSGDEEMRIKAFSALVRADQVDLKREEVAIKKQVVDDSRRLRLLELLRQLPPGVLDQIASRDTRLVEAGRADGAAGTDGAQTSGRKRPTNTRAGKPAKKNRRTQ